MLQLTYYGAKPAANCNFVLNSSSALALFAYPQRRARVVRRRRRAPKTVFGAAGGKSLAASAALGWSAMALGLEASAVIGLRTLKLAKGGLPAKTEAHRMVAEKVQAAMELQAMAVSGALGVDPTGAAAKTVRHYAPKVRANLRRLSKG